MTSAPTFGTSAVRHRIRVRGLVQGVGFRPFVYRLACQLTVAGFVGNDSEGVFIEAEGSPAALDELEHRLRSEAPPLARVDVIEAERITPARAHAEFRIVESHDAAGARTFVAPDTAVCADCLRELGDPADRRYRYPFITCTNCGPRFTITIRLPYDRPNTTMAGFELCAPCAAEYHDPGNRRFHAQPLACARCGPQICFDGPAGRIDGTDAALAATQAALASGAIVAIKGLGGYHLACTATADAPVRRLRERKGRVDKPFAVMVRDVSVARQLATIDDSEAQLLQSPARPIVLVATCANSPLSALVAPGNPFIGVMLPYTPLHHLLFAPGPDRAPGAAPVAELLVLTSGNLTDEPIAFEDADARARLGRIADAWLTHDRPIHVPCDDSVVRIVDGESCRSAGRAPRRCRSRCPSRSRRPWPSAASSRTRSASLRAATRDESAHRRHGQRRDARGVRALGGAVRRHVRDRTDAPSPTPPRLPDPAVGRVSPRAETAELVLVQHHHAHVVAVMAEHGLAPDAEVIGCAYDGTGYGRDGAIWGGEVLRASYGGFERVAHLRYVPLPGGDTTIRKPYRAALAHLWAAGVHWDPLFAPVRAAAPGELAVLERQLARGVQCVSTSSMGRLFDAVSALLGVRQQVSYEAQAAIELEAIAGPHLAQLRDEGAPRYSFGIAGEEIDAAPVVAAVAADVLAGGAIGPIAAGFHLAVARMTADVVGAAADPGAFVALTGGVFQNVLLLRLTRAELRARGFEVLTHRMVPPNDGGLALGQVIAGAASANAWSAS
jgi:hydrogenase maturation protein HypF